MPLASLAEFTLSISERDSQLWKRLAEHLTERLQLLRESNDTPMSETDRNVLIGQIREVKAVLNLGREVKPLTKVQQSFSV